MTNNRRPLRLNVGFLTASPVGTHREFDFNLNIMKLGEELIVSGFSGTASFDRTQQGLLLRGDFRANTELECVRCLEPFMQFLHWSFSDLYAFDENNITDSGLLVPEDAQIDLQPLLREYALLEIPIKPICKPNCKGLCPVCGENLNHADCGHRPKPDSPFAVLKDLIQ